VGAVLGRRGGDVVELVRSDDVSISVDLWSSVNLSLKLTSTKLVFFPFSVSEGAAVSATAACPAGAIAPRIRKIANRTRRMAFTSF
jgi:hypothetical protein